MASSQEILNLSHKIAKIAAIAPCFIMSFRQILCLPSAAAALTTTPLRSTVKDQEFTRTIMPVKHIVMVSLKEDSSDEDMARVKAGFLNLPQQISTIKTYELGQDLKLESGQTHPAGKNRVLSWTLTFDSAEDYETYNSHPKHQEFLKDTLKPAMLPGSRAAIQYDLSEVNE